MGLTRRRTCFLLVALSLFIPALSQAATVEIFSPQGEVKKVRQVTARFSEQMVAFGDPREIEPFDIKCPAEGKGRWADQKNWIYDFDNDLPAGVLCTFTVRKGLTSLGGSPLQEGAVYSFNTGGPAILQSEPYSSSYSQIDENQIFILGLDAPATFASMQKNVHCEVDGISEQIPVRIILGLQRTNILELRKYFLTRYFQASFITSSGISGPVTLGIDEKGSERERFLKLRDSAESPIALVQCQRTLPNTSNVKLVWGKGVTSFSGISTTQDQVLYFHTRPSFEARFSCARLIEEGPCIPAIPMSMNFTAPVPVAMAKKILLVPTVGKALQATISSNDEKGGYTQWVTFPAPLSVNADYKIVLPKIFVDDAGRTLGNSASFPLSVHTDENPPLAKFASNFGILELNASSDTPPLMPVTLRNVENAFPITVVAPLVSGKVMHGSDETGIPGWLRRLNYADSPYNPDTRQWDQDRGPGKQSIFESTDPINVIDIERPIGDKAFEVVGIPLSKPGFYVVELASPTLGAAMHGEERPYYIHAAALVTNLAVHFKHGKESSLVWVTSLDKGKPVPDAKVAVRDCKGKTYAEGNTDVHGMLRIDQPLPNLNSLPGCTSEYDRQFFVTARMGEDFSFVLSSWNEGIALWRFNAFQGNWYSQDVVHAIMDRTLLRAGETIHMKLIARSKNGMGFDAPKSNMLPQVTIQHQGSGDKFQVPVTWDSRGATSLTWTIPQDAKQGTYSVISNALAGTFQVESFRVPTMKALLQSADKKLVNASQATLNIQVNYLSGGGASFLPVKLRGQQTKKLISFADYEDFTFANGGVAVGIQKDVNEAWNIGEYELEDGEEAPVVADATPRNIALSTQELRLDAAGAGHASFADLKQSADPQDIYAELEYLDPNGETLTATTHIPLWSANLLVGIKPESWMASADHLRFHALVVDTEGISQPGVQVSIKAFQREYFSHRRRLIGGFYAFDTRNEIKALGDICQGKTDSKGLLICDVKSPAKGNIILQAETKDASGNPVIAHREIHVAGNEDWWFDASDNDRIDLLPENKRYEPGDMARFQLRMPYKEADVLVTVEREGIMDSFVKHVTRANPTIDVPIKAQYSPNIFVSALAIRGRSGNVQPTALVDLGKPSFKMGLAEINVGWAAHELKVKVATDKPVYKVREKAKVSVDVRKLDGTSLPSDSEVTLVAVDEGLLELKPNDSWKLLETMMARRGIMVNTSTAQMQVIGKRHFGRKALPAGGDGGGKAARARELFDTLLFWKETVKLDKNGRAEALIPLNDSLTSFRIVAIANGGMELFGSGSASVQSTQDLMLFSGLPPVVREQDEFHAGFTVRNASDHSIVSIVSATLNDNALAPVEVNLAAGESKNVGWNVAVPLDREVLKWDVVIREKDASEDGDHLKVSQKVISALPVRTYQATILQLDAPQSIGVQRPDGAIPGRGGIKVTFRKQLGEGLGGVREYMQLYPYTCLEQQASQAVALQDGGRWVRLMSKLPTFLDGNGLAKYWPMMREGDDTLTAYLLSIANEAEYEIPEYAQNKMRNGLIAFVEGRTIRYSAFPTSDLVVRKLAAIEALARTGDVKTDWLDSISIEPNLWPTSAVLDWLSILKHKPDISAKSAIQIEEAKQIIRSRLNFQGTTMGFSTERNDTLWWLMVSGDVNANRVLLTLLDDEQWQPDIPRLVRGTLGRQLQGRWNTTVANAWGVLAMKRFSAKFEAVPVSGSSSAVLEKQTYIENWSDSKQNAQKLLEWPSGVGSLQLSHSGDGKPWVVLQSLAALPLKEPFSTGYRVSRKVEPVSQQVKGEWHKGDVARVHLEIDAQSDMTWVVVNDPIPSGASILGTGLGGDSKLLSQDEKKTGWVWPAFEERTFDAFHAYYRFVPKGKFSVEYSVRLNNEGTFLLPTTRVEAMYSPEMLGELPNESVVVKP